jgi:hypothetical protein
MPNLGAPSASRPIRPRNLVSPPLVRSLSAALLLAQALPAQAEDCRLALVLALDVSGSVSAADDRLQREGLAAALLAPEVTRAFLTGGPVALYVFEWAGSSSQAALLPGWEMIQGEHDLLRVAGALTQGRHSGLRSSGLVQDGTAVGSALVHAAAALESGPGCLARTVDVSGDGVNSQGIDPAFVIESLYDGITVNALVIMESYDDPMLDRRYGGDALLATWFSDAVLNGPGAFYVVADGYEDYERAMTVKLLREIGVPQLSHAVTSGDGPGGKQVEGL